MNGEIQKMPPNKILLADTVENLADLLKASVDRKTVQVRVSNFGLVIRRDPLTTRVPDIAVFLRSNVIEQDGYIHSAPGISGGSSIAGKHACGACRETEGLRESWSPRGLGGIARSAQRRDPVAPGRPPDHCCTAAGWSTRTAASSERVSGYCGHLAQITWRTRPRRLRVHTRVTPRTCFFLYSVCVRMSAQCHIVFPELKRKDACGAGPCPANGKPEACATPPACPVRTNVQTPVAGRRLSDTCPTKRSCPRNCVTRVRALRRRRNRGGHLIKSVESLRITPDSEKGGMDHAS